MGNSLHSWLLAELQNCPQKDSQAQGEAGVCIKYQLNHPCLFGLLFFHNTNSQSLSKCAFNPKPSSHKETTPYINQVWSLKADAQIAIIFFCIDYSFKPNLPLTHTQDPPSVVPGVRGTPHVIPLWSLPCAALLGTALCSALACFSASRSHPRTRNHDRHHNH